MNNKHKGEYTLDGKRTLKQTLKHHGLLFGGSLLSANLFALYYASLSFPEFLLGPFFFGVGTGIFIYLLLHSLWALRTRRNDLTAVDNFFIAGTVAWIFGMSAAAIFGWPKGVLETQYPPLFGIIAVVSGAVPATIAFIVAIGAIGLSRILRPKPGAMDQRKRKRRRALVPAILTTLVLFAFAVAVASVFGMLRLTILIDPADPVGELETIADVAAPLLLFILLVAAVPFFRVGGGNVWLKSVWVASSLVLLIIGPFTGLALYESINTIEPPFTGVYQSGVVEHDDRVYAATMNGEEDLLATGSAVGMKISELHEGKPTNSKECLFGTDGPYAISRLKFSPNGYQIAVLRDAGDFFDDDRTVSIVDAGTCNFFDIELGAAVFGDMAFSPKGDFLAIAVGNEIKIWNTGRGVFVGVLKHDSYIESVQFDSSGRFVLTASLDTTAKVWDAKSRKAVSILDHSDYVLDAVFSPDDKTVVTASRDGSVTIWDWPAKKKLKKLIGHTGRVSMLAINPDGIRLITVGWYKSILWSIATGEAICEMSSHKEWITHVLFSPSGNTFATGSQGGTARLRNALTGALLYVIQNPEYSTFGSGKAEAGEVTALEYSSSGHYLVVASKSDIITVHYIRSIDQTRPDSKPPAHTLDPRGC